MEWLYENYWLLEGDEQEQQGQVGITKKDLEEILMLSDKALAKSFLEFYVKYENSGIFDDAEVEVDAGKADKRFDPNTSVEQKYASAFAIALRKIDLSKVSENESISEYISRLLSKGFEFEHKVKMRVKFSLEPKHVSEILESAKKKASSSIAVKLKKYLVGAPKKVAAKVWEWIKQLFNKAKENKGKTFGIISAIIAIGAILYFLKDKFPIIGKFFRMLGWIASLPLRLVRKIMNLFKKDTDMPPPELSSVPSDIGSDSGTVAALFEQYISNPTFRRAYDNYINSIHTYMVMYLYV